MGFSLELPVAAPPCCGQTMGKLPLGIFQLLALKMAHAQVQRHLGSEVGVVERTQLQQCIAMKTQAGVPRAHRIVNLAQPDTGCNAHPPLAGGLGQVQCPRPLLGGFKVVASLVRRPTQGLSQAGCLLAVSLGPLLQSICASGKRFTQVERTARMLRQMEPQIKQVGRRQDLLIPFRLLLSSGERSFH